LSFNATSAEKWNVVKESKLKESTILRGEKLKSATEKKQHLEM